MDGERARRVAAWWNGAHPDERAEPEWVEELVAAWTAATSVPQADLTAAERVREMARRLPDAVVFAVTQDRRVRGRVRRRRRCDD